MPSSDQDFEAFSEFERTGWERPPIPIMRIGAIFHPNLKFVSTCHQTVMLLTAGNHDLERQSVHIDDGMDFVRQPSTRTSETFAGIALVATCLDGCGTCHARSQLFSEL